MTKTIKTTLYYKRFSRVEYWCDNDISFNEYKESVKYHLGTTNFSNEVNSYKKMIKKRIDMSINIKGVKNSFNKIWY